MPFPSKFAHCANKLMGPEANGINRAEMQDAFDSVLSEVERCIDEYVNDQALKPDLIFVSGGFGKSRFLDQRLRTRFNGIQVLTPCYYNKCLQ